MFARTQAFGTVEVRICDGLPTFDAVIAMTAMIQALVVWLGDRYDEGDYLPLQRYWIVRENKWRASRWALDAEIIVDEAGHLERLSESIRKLLTALTPVRRTARVRHRARGCRHDPGEEPQLPATAAAV